MEFIDDPPRLQGGSRPVRESARGTGMQHSLDSFYIETSYIIHYRCGTMKGASEVQWQSASAGVTSFERDVIALFIQLAQLFSLPRSVGEIYGMLFLSDRPLSQDDFVETLGISKGSVSQGLRGLRELGAVRQVYVPGDRRDYFVAEMELRKIARGILKERVEPHFAEAGQQITRLSDAVSRVEAGKRKLMRDRISRLQGWQRNGRKLLPLLKTLLGS